MLFALLLAENGATPQEGPPPWASMMPLILIGGVFVLMTFMSSRTQKRQHAALLAGLKKNDRVVNSGGIIGVVESVKEKEDEVVLKGGLRVTKSSIVRVLADDSAKETDK
jgi:preprotein translocase subunit YajC